MKVTLEISEQDLNNLVKDKNIVVYRDGDIKERVKTYADACAELGVELMNEEKMISAGFTPAEIARRKLETITSVLNEGWVADWSNPKQNKWIPYIIYRPGSPSGFRFYASYYDNSTARAGSGSRLCFKTKELSDYAGEQFLGLYTEILK